MSGIVNSNSIISFAKQCCTVLRQLIEKEYLRILLACALLKKDGRSFHGISGQGRTSNLSSTGGELGFWEISF